MALITYKVYADLAVVKGGGALDTWIDFPVAMTPAEENTMEGGYVRDFLDNKCLSPFQAAGISPMDPSAAADRTVLDRINNLFLTMQRQEQIALALATSADKMTIECYGLKGFVTALETPSRISWKWICTAIGIPFLGVGGFLGFWGGRKIDELLQASKESKKLELYVTASAHRKRALFNTDSNIKRMKMEIGYYAVNRATALYDELKDIEPERDLKMLQELKMLYQICKDFLNQPMYVHGHINISDYLSTKGL